MTTTVTKWGNSFGIRLSKVILNSMGIDESDEVSVTLEENRIVITKAFPTSIKELFKDYTPVTQKEVDWGEQQGEEIC